MLAATPRPPYYAVIFTSLRTPEDPEGYAVTAERMVELASGQPGFLGIESARGDDGLGITVSYWESLDAIRSWGAHVEHRLAQQLGRARWYRTFCLRVCRVESDRLFDSESGEGQKSKTATGPSHFLE
jgi:heme-degrading monooxygenase HmoA